MIKGLSKSSSRLSNPLSAPAPQNRLMMSYLGQGLFWFAGPADLDNIIVYVDIFADCARSRGVIPRGGWICIKLSCFGAHKGAQPRRGGIQRGHPFRCLHLSHTLTPRSDI